MCAKREPYRDTAPRSDVADHLTDPHLVILHVGHDEKNYQAKYIPGSEILLDGQVCNESFRVGNRIAAT